MFSLFLSLFFCHRELSDEKLKEVFSAYGPVQEARIVRSQGEWSRGYGFVTFADEASAQKALDGLNAKQVEGREIRIEFAHSTGPQPPRSAGSNGQMGLGGGGGGPPRGRGRGRGGFRGIVISSAVLFFMCLRVVFVPSSFLQAEADSAGVCDLLVLLISLFLFFDAFFTSLSLSLLSGRGRGRGGSAPPPAADGPSQ